MAPQRKTLAERFWPKVAVAGPDECWPWIGAMANKGYGVMAMPGRDGIHTSAQRISWIIHNGEIPAGLQVLHSCDNPPCVNPGHLFLGTVADNVSDKMAKGRFRNGWVSGEYQHKAKLKTADVIEIRRHGGRIPDLAEKYGVNVETIRAVVKGQTWRHVVVT